jgi:hypothetical protein
VEGGQEGVAGVEILSTGLDLAVPRVRGGRHGRFRHGLGRGREFGCGHRDDRRCSQIGRARRLRRRDRFGRDSWLGDCGSLDFGRDSWLGDCGSLDFGRDRWLGDCGSLDFGRDGRLLRRDRFGRDSRLLRRDRFGRDRAVFGLGPQATFRRLNGRFGRDRWRRRRRRRECRHLDLDRRRSHPTALRPAHPARNPGEEHLEVRNAPFQSPPGTLTSLDPAIFRGRGLGGDEEAQGLLASGLDVDLGGDPSAHQIARAPAHLGQLQYRRNIQQTASGQGLELRSSLQQRPGAQV